MGEKKEIGAIYDCLRLVLPLMSRYDIPVTPQNYAVWFAYVSESNSKLCKTINDMIDNGHAFNEETNEDLYRRYGLTDNEKNVNELLENLKQVLVAILKEVLQLGGRTNQFESTLSECADRLSEDLTIKDIKGITSAIITETKNIGRFSQDLQRHLKEQAKELEILREKFKRTQVEALTDFLTGLANRKGFDQTIESLFGRAERNEMTLCLLFVDVDHFKKFNDTHGHLIGDQVLRFIAKKIKENVRGQDYVARYGGEEFAVLLPRTHLQGAKSVAENIRHFFDQATLKTSSENKQLGNITVSVGVSSYRSGDSLESFIERCDQALYFAKNSGRNRVALELDVD